METQPEDRLVTQRLKHRGGYYDNHRGEIDFGKISLVANTHRPSPRRSLDDQRLLAWVNYVEQSGLKKCSWEGCFELLPNNTMYCPQHARDVALRRKSPNGYYDKEVLMNVKCSKCRHFNEGTGKSCLKFDTNIVAVACSSYRHSDDLPPEYPSCIYNYASEGKHFCFYHGDKPDGCPLSPEECLGCEARVAISGE